MNCTHSQDTGVRCFPCTNGSIRLQGGNSTCGRVEVCIDHNWKVICDHLWDVASSEVACRQLGFSSAGIHAWLILFQQINSLFYTLDNVVNGFSNDLERFWTVSVECAGTEDRLIDCPMQAGGTNASASCMGLCCTTCTAHSIRLRGGTATEGRVEVCIGGIWGTVCGEPSWSIREAQVTCRQLGLPSGGEYKIPVYEMFIYFSK